jgi:tyrosinase
MAQPAKIRRDVNQLAPNDPILEAYRRAVTEMRRLTTEEPNNPLGWTKQATIHNQFCPHANWFFLPWHRAYLAYLEDVCRKLSGDDSFALPYWDWTRNPQIPAPFWGTGNSLNHPRTATPQSTLRSEFVGPEVLDRIMRKLDFEGFGSLRSTLPRGGSGGGSSTLEGTPHNRVHGFVGRDMATFMSPLDPIFWLHHCNVDRIWASWNKNGNANPPDSSFAGFVLKGNFVDRSGAAVDVKISDLYDTGPHGYVYDRLEPRPPSPVEVLGPDMSLGPTNSFSQAVAVDGEPGIPVSTNVAVKPALLSSFAAGLGELAVQNLQPSKAPVETAVLRVTGVQPPEDPRAYVRVFLNCPYLTEETPINDPHYVSTFAFFTERGGGHGAHADEGVDFAFDLTDTLDALRRSQRFPEAALEPQLLAFNGEDQPIALSVEGKAEIVFLRAERTL